MKKNMKVKIFKYVLLFVCAFLWIFPTISAAIEEVKLTDYDMTYNEETNRYDCVLVCDKNIVNGTVEIGFYNANGTLIKKVTKTFEDNKGNKAVVYFETTEINDFMEIYKVEELKVETETQDTVSAVCYLSAIALTILVLTIIKIDIFEYNIDGKRLEIYSGVRRKTMKIDGMLVAEKKKMFYRKPIMLAAQVGNKQVVAEIKSSGKIELYTKELDKKEDSLKKENLHYDVSEEEMEFFKKVEEEVLKPEAVKEINQTKEPENKKVMVEPKNGEQTKITTDSENK